MTQTTTSPPDSPATTALLTLVEATHLSGGAIHEELWLELERSALSVDALCPLLLRDMQAGGTHWHPVTQNPRNVCPKLRTCLRWLASQYTLGEHTTLICQSSVLQHHGRGKIAGPDLTLITDLLHRCSACPKTMISTLGDLPQRNSWTRASQQVIQDCLDAMEAHLQRAARLKMPEGSAGDVHLRATAHALIRVARTLPDHALMAFWKMALRLPEEVHVAVINALSNNAQKNPTLISSLMLAQARKLRAQPAPVVAD